MSKHAQHDDRILRQEDDDRAPRGQTFDAHERAETGMDDDIEALLATEFDQVALPTAPEIPGFHMCWLTTTSTYDSLQKRMRLGYTPVKQSELPNWKVDSGMTSGAATDDTIRCNEMILCKIPMARYQAIMNHYHHKVPLQFENAVIEQASQAVEGKAQRAHDVEADEGLMQMRSDAQQAALARPIFA